MHLSYPPYMPPVLPISVVGGAYFGFIKDKNIHKALNA
jgi:hypothetical protein